MGRKALYPKGEEMVAFLEANPGLTYPELWEKWGGGGNPKGFGCAARRVGEKRLDRRPMDGGGPLDIMPDEEFWGQVGRTLDELRVMREARLQHVRGGINTLRRATTTATRTAYAE